MASITRRKLHVIDWSCGVDLRFVTWRQSTLEAVLLDEKVQLKEGEGFLVSNWAEDRFRIIERHIGGLLVLVIPSFDSMDKTSLYLKISQFLQTHYVLAPVVRTAVTEEIECFSEENVA